VSPADSAPSAAPTGEGLAENDVLALFDELSNQGRWGPDDQRGTLNYITSETVRAAAGLVRSGRVVSVAHDLDTVPSTKNYNPPSMRLLYRGHRPIVSADQFTVIAHGFAVTHVDALAHMFFQDRVYNGRSAEDVVRPDGVHFGSIHAMREGIVTRGVLLDVASARGVPWLRPGDGVTPEDLERAEARASVRTRSGDAIFVRVGLGAREAAEGPEDPALRAGLVPACLSWLHRREVAVYSGDCIEQRPSPYPRVPWPLHMIGIAGMGLVLLDNTDVEPLARACAAEGRWEFLVMVAPLRIPRGTGSPVNPLCVF
jgi:kynurenine formamidase